MGFNPFHYFRKDLMNDLTVHLAIKADRAVFKFDRKRVVNTGVDKQGTIVMPSETRIDEIFDLKGYFVFIHISILSCKKTLVNKKMADISPNKSIEANFPDNLLPGDKWWLVSAAGFVTYSIYGRCFTADLFEWNRKIGNMFPTEEAAEESLLTGIWAERIRAVANGRG